MTAIKYWSPHIVVPARATIVENLSSGRSVGTSDQTLEVNPRVKVGRIHPISKG